MIIKSINIRLIAFPCLGYLMLSSGAWAGTSSIVTVPADTTGLPAHTVVIKKDASVKFTCKANATNGNVEPEGYAWTFPNGTPFPGDDLKGAGPIHVTFSNAAIGQTSECTVGLTHTGNRNLEVCTPNTKVLWTTHVLVPQVNVKATAKIPSTQERSSYGVGETAIASLNPSSLNKVTWDWTVTSTGTAGTIATSGGTTTYTAGDAAVTDTLTAKLHSDSTISAIKDLTILTPSSESATKDGEWPFADGYPGVGMKLVIIVAPTSVSFANVDMLEEPEDATNVNGYYTNVAAASLHHNPNASWVRLAADNSWIDQAGHWGETSPWSSGSYTWDIPIHWKIHGKSTDYDLGHNRTQVNSMTDSLGTDKVTKLGQTGGPRTP